MLLNMCAIPPSRPSSPTSVAPRAPKSPTPATMYPTWETMWYDRRRRMLFWKTANVTPYTAMRPPMRATYSDAGAARARRYTAAFVV